MLRHAGCPFLAWVCCRLTPCIASCLCGEACCILWCLPSISKLFLSYLLVTFDLRVGMIVEGGINNKVLIML